MQDLAPVQMLGCKLLHLVCEINASFDPSLEKEAHYSTELKLMGPQEVALPNLDVMVAIDYVKNNEGCRYSHVFIHGGGRFVVAPEVPAENIRTYAIPSAVSMLYGALRGFLVMITTSFAGDALVLPALNPQHFTPESGPIIHPAAPVTPPAAKRGRRKRHIEAG